MSIRDDQTDLSPTAYGEAMLLLVDLDNSLVDRASAFNSWSIDFVRLL